MISFRWTGVTTRTPKLSAKLSTCAPPMATAGLPSTASSAPTAHCSTRPTLSASTGSTSTARKLSPSTVSTIRSGSPRALEVLTVLPPPHLEVTQHLRLQQPPHLDTQPLPQTIPLRPQKTTLPRQLRNLRAMRRRSPVATEPPSRTRCLVMEQKRDVEGSKEVAGAGWGSRASSRLEAED